VWTLAVTAVAFGMDRGGLLLYSFISISLYAALLAAILV
jgi:hypothetical protein